MKSSIKSTRNYLKSIMRGNNMSNYKRAEGMLYNHYKRKDRINRLVSKRIRLEYRIDNLKRDIRECRYELDSTLQGIDYSKDKIQTNSVTSSIEQELLLAEERVLRELEYTIREKRKTQEKIRYLEKKIDETEILLEDLAEEEKQILEMKYSEKMSDKIIADMLNMSRTTIQRRRTELIECIGEEMEKMGRNRAESGQLVI